MKRYSVQIKINNKFFGTEPTREVAENLLDDFEKRNGVIVENFSLSGNVATVVFHRDTSADFSQDANYMRAGWPVVILAVISGIAFIGVSVWTWEVVSGSLTELAEAADNLFDNPIVKAGVYGVVGYMAVEMLRKWKIL